MTEIKKIIQRTALAILLIILLAASSLFVFGKYFEERVKEIIVSEINKQSLTEITVEKIELSLLRRFPYASLGFYSVSIQDSDTENPGTLLKAGYIYLNFKIWDIFNDKYDIKRIDISDGYLVVKVAEDETGNYNIFDQKSDTGITSFDLKLERVFLNNININYINRASDIEAEITVKKARLRGRLSEKKYNFTVGGDYFIHKLQSENHVFLKDVNSSSEFRLQHDVDEDKYTFTNAKLSINKHNFEVKGSFQFHDKYAKLDFNIIGSNLNMAALLAELPETLAAELADYRFRGLISFNSHFSGNIGGAELPLINTDFALSSGSVKHRKSNVEIDDLSLTASWTNGSSKKMPTNALKISRFNGRMKNHDFSGNLSIHNFIHPEIDLIVSASSDLELLSRFLQNPDIIDMSGVAELNFSYRGKIDENWNFSYPLFASAVTSGDLKLKNAGISLSKSSYSYERINGSFKFNNNDIIIEDLDMYVQNNNFKMKGYFRNMIPYLFEDNQTLELNASLFSPHILSDNFLEESGQGADLNIKIPENISADLNCSIDKLDFDKFTCSQLKTKLRIRNRQVLFSSLTFNSMQGSVVCSGMIDGRRDGKLLISSDAELKGIDVRQLFYQMNNFGQNSLTYEHISGVLKGNIQFAGVWNSDLSPDYSSLNSRADVTIEEGRLINYEPMKGLSRFISVEELSDIQFSTLTNTIVIKNEIIEFPAMEIKSNAINLTASGTHDFDNNINYHIRILLKDILSRKAGRKKENLEFGVVSSEGVPETVLFILVTGNVDNPRFRYDRAGVSGKLKQDIKEERQHLKEILNKEFGWFHSDTSLANPRMRESTRRRIERREEIKEAEKGKFIIEWEEEEDGL